MILRVEVEQALSIKNALQKEWKISSRLYKKLWQNDSIYLNGQVCHTNKVVYSGDIIEARLDFEHNTYEAYEMDLEIIYEDDALLVMNKKSGIVVHPTKGTREATLLHGVSHYQKLTKQDFKIRFVHRLDQNTSGVIIVAKNKYVHQILSEQFMNRTIEKYYAALVKGKIREPFVCEYAIGLSEDGIHRMRLKMGKQSKTSFFPVLSDDRYTLLLAKPHTGRTHQIRVHLAEAGFPIVGDELYGSLEKERLMLHARRLNVLHPITHQELVFEAPLPENMILKMNGDKMNKELLKRINELAKKDKEGTLTEEEFAERKILRAKYLEEFRTYFRAKLENLDIEYIDDPPKNTDC